MATLYSGDPDVQYEYDHLEDEYRDLERASEVAQDAINRALSPKAEKPEEVVTLCVSEFTSRAQAMLEKPTVQLGICDLECGSLEQVADLLELVVKALRAK